MIRFNKPSITALEEQYLLDALQDNCLSGDGRYTTKVCKQMKALFGIEHFFLTTSGTTSLEMASILIELDPGDEVIVPSFTFSSTVNAFLLRRAVPVFCDIRSDTLNIDESLIEEKITSKTKAIYVVHYAGIPCEMDTIMEIARRHNLFVIEDAAQAVGSTYKGRPAGTISELGCYSFHETKNYIMGEGGGLVINQERFVERAEIIREKGTNRKNVLRGVVDRYTWHDIGSSFLPSDILAALLSAQLERFHEIMEKRMHIWNSYESGLADLEQADYLRRLKVPKEVTGNGHMYNIVLPNSEVRSNLIAFLHDKGIMSYICYVPLHSAPMGQKLGYRPESVPITEALGERVLRLPLYTGMSQTDINFILEQIHNYFK